MIVCRVKDLAFLFMLLRGMVAVVPIPLGQGHSLGGRKGGTGKIRRVSPVNSSCCGLNSA